MSFLLFVLVVYMIIKYRDIPDQVKREKYHLNFTSVKPDQDSRQIPVCKPSLKKGSQTLTAVNPYILWWAVLGLNQ
jgi:alpha-glucuronidase